ncbi:hypothetical protein J14TS5_22880 [Paenibacillus lautus]|uniref:hypothetical protein n=1 Tax=Paenibacillus lautus TaxID=1401 RepID=UPI001B0AFF3B|nr:hypothetical protein [Paenibacillus lautus]GIO97202.1 hypothetical protein J14TS5_22880 [Paenibacillus lautus]
MYVVAVLLGVAGASFAAALPLILGRLYQATGSYTAGFIILSIIDATSLALTVVMQLKWRRSWLRSVPSGPQAGSAKI